MTTVPARHSAGGIPGSPAEEAACNLYFTVHNSGGDRDGYYVGTTDEGERKFVEHNGTVFYAEDDATVTRATARHPTFPTAGENEIVGV